MKNLPGIGAAIAVVGLLLFLFATHSMDWIDAPGLSLDLGEFQDVAEDADAYLGAEWYGSWLWAVTFIYIVVVAVFSTVLNPPNKGARIAMWFLVVGLISLVNLSDEEGRVAPRILGPLSLVFPALVLTFVWLSTTLGDYGTSVPEPKTGDMGMGLWMSYLGVVIVAVGCAVGTRTVRSTPQLGGPPPGVPYAPPPGPVPAGPPR